VTVHVAPPGEAVTVYEVGTTPVLGAVTVIVTCPSPGTAVGAGGVPGAVMCVELFATD